MLLNLQWIRVVHVKGKSPIFRQNHVYSLTQFSCFEAGSGFVWEQGDPKTCGLSVHHVLHQQLPLWGNRPNFLTNPSPWYLHDIPMISPIICHDHPLTHINPLFWGWSPHQEPPGATFSRFGLGSTGGAQVGDGSKFKPLLGTRDFRRCLVLRI